MLLVPRTRYTYDSLNQLTRVEYPGYTEELYYDRAGNRRRRVSAGVEESYKYDPANHLTEYTKGGVKTTFTYDNAGNLTADDRARYTYDLFNRTEKVETFDGHVQINRYDAEGLRHEMEEDGKLVQFIFRGQEVVMEETDTNRIRHIRGYELIASDAESARMYYHYASDEMGSITHVAEGKDVLNRYEYDAWGNLTLSEETVENRFKFNGQQYDPISQQYYLRARYYNPVTARFTQEDTYRGDGLNLYAYCRNNPVYYTDPSGHSCDKDATQRQPEGSGSFADQLAQHVADEIAFNQEHGLTTQYDTPQAEAANRRVEQDSQTDTSANRPSNPEVAGADNNSRRSGDKTYTVDPSMQAKDIAEKVLVDGVYKINPTTQNISELIKPGSNYVGNSRMNGQFMYVVDTDGNIIIGSRAGQHMPHPTLIGGPNPTVQGAGIVEIRGGKIYSIDNASGHFKPDSSCMINVQNAFEQLPSNVFHRNFQGYSTIDD